MLEEVAESPDYYLRNLEEDKTARNQSLIRKTRQSKANLNAR